MSFFRDPFKVLGLITAVGVVGVTAFYLRYKSIIHKRKKKIMERLTRGLVYRETSSKNIRTVVKAFELNPVWVSEISSEYQVCSMGEYLSTLRFYGDDYDDDGDEGSSVQNMLKKELYTVLASLVLKALGQTIGGAVLPLLGAKPAQSALESISSNIVSHMISKVLVKSSMGNWDPTNDLAALHMNVTELSSLINLNQKINGGNMDISPMTWMKRGEIGYEPSFHTPSAEEGGDAASGAEEVLIPNPFVVEKHFDAAIHGMEERIRSFQRKDGGKVTYDSEDKSMPEPVPINSTILPDLYLGNKGIFTHNKREQLLNRLFAVVLTKLSHNYELRKLDQDDEFFVVRAYGTDCTCPDEFLEVLCNNGHSIEVCPRGTVTTFGIQTCCKEADGSWSNIPLGVFFRTGYESASTRPAYYHLLHGGLDLKIKGPLVGVNEKTGNVNNCDIQFYMAIDGLCGWHSNHNPDVPWMKLNPSTDIYKQKDALAAVRISGILGCAYNQIGFEMDLPFGGYGLVGVCNDTAAMVDFTVRGQTDMYPLLSTGRFLMHTASFLVKIHDGMTNGKCSAKMKVAAADALRLASTAGIIQSDIHCNAKQMVGAYKRFKSNYPTPYFQINVDSLEVFEEIHEKHLDLQEKLSKV